MKLHIFYNGTDSNYYDDFREQGRFQHGEIVSRFGYYAQGSPLHRENVLRIHGVGGSKEDGATPAVLGTLFGVRMRDDVQNIVSFVMDARMNLKIANKNEQADTSLIVTMMGWSRGGIGCIYAAHMLSKIWNEVEKYDPSSITLSIKVIAMDPVSGLGTNIRALDLGWLDLTVMSARLWLSSYTGSLSTTIVSSLKTVNDKLVNWWELPRQVTEFHGFYAHDERSVGFAPTMPTMTGDITGRDFNLYGVPGTHSTLVGNLYPAGGDQPATNNLACPVGLHVYRSVVKKVAELMRTWQVTFDDNEYKAWLKSLYINADLALDQVIPVSSEALSDYKNKAQLVALTPSFLNPLNQRSVPLLTDGRGVYIGGNKQDRKWKPASSIEQFMNEQNTKSLIDSAWQMVIGSESKLGKLGGNVHAHNYNRATSNWA